MLNYCARGFERKWWHTEKQQSGVDISVTSMANKRRTRAQTNAFKLQSDGSSTNDSDHQQQRTRDVIYRLSKKYLKTEADLKKKNRRSVTQSPEYDADQESVDSTESSQDTKSSVSSLYDFLGDDEEDTVNKATDKKSAKSTGKRSVKIKKSKGVKIPVSKAGRGTKNVTESYVTPKGRVGKVKVTASPAAQLKKNSGKNKSKKVDTTTVLQQVSNKLSQEKSSGNRQKPIAVSHMAVGKKRKLSVSAEGSKKRDIQSFKKQRRCVTKTEPSAQTVSFLESGTERNSRNDSGIFMSPPQARLRFSTSVSNTPAPPPAGRKKRSETMKFKAKDTSTPTTVFVKSEKGTSKMKSSVPEFSPVPRLETPLSDYHSFDGLETPSPVLRSVNGSPSPCFSLDNESDVPTLNRSTKKTYKKTKKPYLKSRDRQLISKAQEFAEKMYREFEELDSYELSIEG